MNELIDEIIRENNRKAVEEHDRKLMPLYLEALSKIKHPHFQKAVIWLKEGRVEIKRCVNLRRKPKIEVIYGPFEPVSVCDWDDRILTEDKATKYPGAML